MPWPEGVCTDEFLSRKPGFLLSAMHSHAFRWFSAAPKQLQENQAVAWILKTKEKNPPKQESLVFLEMTRVGEKAEHQRKSRGNPR
jgi:hypothetical protein